MTLLSDNILNEKEYDCPGSFPVVGSYYLVMYKGELWPRQVIQVKSSGQIEIAKCLEKADAPKDQLGNDQSKKMSMITQSVMLNRK